MVLYLIYLVSNTIVCTTIVFDMIMLLLFLLDDMPKLLSIRLYGNQFTGHIPLSLGKLPISIHIVMNMRLIKSYDRTSI